MPMHHSSGVARAQDLSCLVELANASRAGSITGLPCPAWELSRVPEYSSFSLQASKNKPW